MSTQASSWEAVEANLNDRLLESQEQLIAVEEKVYVTQFTVTPYTIQITMNSHWYIYISLGWIEHYIQHIFPFFSKERVVSEELFDVRGRLTAETSKAASLSTEKTLLKTELETLMMKLTAAEEAKSAQVLIIILVILCFNRITPILCEYESRVWVWVPSMFVYILKLICLSK